MVQLWNQLAPLLDASGYDNLERESEEGSPSNVRLTSAAWMGWYEEDT